MKQGLGWVFNFDEVKNERTKSNKVNQYKVAQLNN